MTLQRKAYKVGDSLVVAIPWNLAELHDITPGSMIEFQPMEKGVFKIIASARLCRIQRIGSDETRLINAEEGRCNPPKGWTLVK